MISVRNVTKCYGDGENFAVDGLSLEINTKDFIAILGPNGAGKTTLMGMITGLIDDYSGDILIDSQKVSRDKTEIKSKIGMVTQHISLDKELSVRENLFFAGLLYKMNRKDINKKIEELLEVTELKKVENRVCRKLSGGMKRKLMIARALIHDPEIILLDEPTVGIDVQARREIWNLLKKMNLNGKTILLTTHYIEEAEYLCNSVALIDEGKILHHDTPAALIEKIGAYSLEMDDDILNKETKHFKTLEKAKEYAEKLNETFRIRKSTLEDVFVSITDRRVDDGRN